MEMGGQTNIGIVKEVLVVPRFDATEAAGVNGLNFGAIFSPLVKSLGEGSNMGQELGWVQETLSEGIGTGNKLV